MIFNFNLKNHQKWFETNWYPVSGSRKFHMNHYQSMISIWIKTCLQIYKAIKVTWACGQEDLLSNHRFHLHPKQFFNSCQSWDFHIYQVIQAVPFSSPIVGGHVFTPWKGHVFTIPKRSRIESPGTGLKKKTYTPLRSRQDTRKRFLWSE